MSSLPPELASVAVQGQAAAKEPAAVQVRAVARAWAEVQEPAAEQEQVQQVQRV